MAEEKKPAAPKATAPKKPAAPKKPVAEKAEAKAVKAPKEVAPKKETAPKKEAAPKVAAKKETAPKAEKVKKEVAVLSIKAPAKKAAPKKDSYQARFKTQYEEKIRPVLLKEFGYKSSMAIPRIVKIVINSGVGDAVSDKNVVDNAQNDITIIAAQKAVKTIARKSVSNFKLREGMPIGVKVTLRGNRMFDFLDKVISTALPRVRDFRGVKSTGFDGRGNFTFGLREQIVFPEINYDKIDKVRGMDISIVTTARTDAEARSLLNQFGFPFRAK